MTPTDALAGLLFVHLGAIAVLVVARGALQRVVAAAALAAPLLFLVPLTGAVAEHGTLTVALGGWAAPLGIRAVADPLAVVMLWLALIVGGLAGWAAIASRADASPWFWPLWFTVLAGCNALFLSADLFNLYVTLELVVLAATPLIAFAGSATAIRAAMRYLLLAMLASLAYLVGIALLYAAHGTLDLYQLGTVVTAGWSDRAALALITVGLLLKTAVFPLHVWLPSAHASAPGPVSAILSALVVKVSLYMLYRIWMWTGAALDPGAMYALLGVLGAGAVVYGALAALTQPRLKLVVAYSTVAQLGYLMLLFPLASAAAWHGANYHLLSHGLAKAAMFLAAANLVVAARNDRVDGLAGIDRVDPVSVFAFGLAGVSIMGLPPSGGFTAKWTLLQAALAAEAWGWLAVLVGGSLLAAAYILRVLAAVFTAPAPGILDGKRPAALPARVAALVLALMSVAAGFTATPVFDFLDLAPPPGVQ